MKAGFYLPFCLAALLLALVAIHPGGASAQALTTGIGDPLFFTGDAGERERWLDETTSAGAGVARIDLRWSTVVGRHRPADPTDPADPAYRFDAIDNAVRAAHARGLRILLTVFRAPGWADAPDRPTDPLFGGYLVAPGTWNPDPVEFGRFATAVARRYSGEFKDLPRVRYFESWNEPNLASFLNPQLEGKRMVSAEVYRGLLNAMYDGIHSVHDDNVVVAGATAPYGSPISRPEGELRVRPLVFLRELLCLKYKTKRIKVRKGKRSGGKSKWRFKRVKRLVRKSCPVPARLDALSHHPISIKKGPSGKTRHRDDASTADMGRIREVLRRAEKLKTIAPANKRKRPVWVTEFWWKSNPPDPAYGVAPRVQAEWIQESLFRFWQGGASTAIYYFIKDREVGSEPLASNDPAGSGLFHFDGRPKPSLRTFSFPFYAHRVNRKKVRLWTVAPAAGRVVFERKVKRRWRRVAVRRAKKGRVVQASLRLLKGRGKSPLRVRSGSRTSLVYRLR